MPYRLYVNFFRRSKFSLVKHFLNEILGVRDGSRGFRFEGTFAGTWCYTG